MTVKAPASMINNSTSGLSPAVRGQMPGNDAMKKAINRRRWDKEGAPAQPTNLQTIIIPDSFKTYEISAGQEESFLLFDSGADVMRRILIFGRESNALWCYFMEHVYVDGTFRICPQLFKQVWSLCKT